MLQSDLWCPTESIVRHGLSKTHRSLSHLPGLLLSRSCDKLTSRGVSSAISGSSSALLDLSLAGISGLTDDISSALRALTSLTRLVLYGCENVGDPTVRALAAMPSLRYLNLKGCRGVSSESVAWLRGRVRVWGKRGTLLLDARCDPDRSAST